MNIPEDRQTEQARPLRIPRYVHRQRALTPDEIAETIDRYNAFVTEWNAIEVDRSRPLVDVINEMMVSTYTWTRRGPKPRPWIYFSNGRIVAIVTRRWQPWQRTGIFGAFLRNPLRLDQVTSASLYAGRA